MQYKIFKFQFSKNWETVVNKSTWLDLSEEKLTPDGGCISSDGRIFIAIWDGFKVIELNVNGNIVNEFKVPVPRPTNCVLDTKEELQKIIEATNNAKDLTLYIRVSISNEHAEIDLSQKFGALPSEALGLLRLAKAHAKKVGLSFHVGSQCMHPISYAKGIREVGNIIKKTKIIPDYINIGGGFPTIYPDLVPQSLENYMDEIKKSLENLNLKNMPQIICEPGRALVAESGSTIVRVNLRKKQKLYINDGTYGTLFDAGTPNIVFPSKMIKDSSNKIISKKLTAFDFYGPTCDSMDYMKGPFLLPNNIKENDYIELGQLGSYGLTFRTQFNGFYSDEIYEVEDSPIMSLYGKDANKSTLVA